MSTSLGVSAAGPEMVKTIRTLVRLPFPVCELFTEYDALAVGLVVLTNGVLLAMVAGAVTAKVGIVPPTSWLFAVLLVASTTTGLWGLPLESSCWSDEVIVSGPVTPGAFTATPMGNVSLNPAGMVPSAIVPVMLPPLPVITGWVANRGYPAVGHCGVPDAMSAGQ